MMFLRRSFTLALIVAIPIVQCQIITDAPTTVPSMVPSSGLIEGVNPSPSMVVVNTNETSSEVPSSVPVPDEVDVPVGLEQETSSEVPSTVPIAVAPIPPVAPVPVPVLAIPPPTLNTQSELCELNEACAALNLTGQCCPTIDEQFLYCCNGFIEPTCQRNDKCAALGLEGACCPTAGNIPSNLDGIYLDCCSTVPDECATEKQSKRVGPDSNSTTNSTDAPSSSCVRMAAVEYKEALNEYNNGSSATAALSLRSVVMVIMTVATVITTTLL